MLKMLFTSPGLCLECQMHCVSTAPQAAIIVSGRLRLTMPISTRKNAAESVPVTPGRRTLNPEAISVAARYSMKPGKLRGFQCSMAPSSAPQPRTTTVVI